MFTGLTVNVSFLERKRSDSWDVCARGVTVSDGPALVKLASHVEPRRTRR